MVLFRSVEAGDGEAEKENYAPTSWQALNLLCQRRQHNKEIFED